MSGVQAGRKAEELGLSMIGGVSVFAMPLSNLLISEFIRRGRAEDFSPLSCAVHQLNLINLVVIDPDLDRNPRGLQCLTGLRRFCNGRRRM